MPAITIATSITPRNFALQRIAIDSWLKLGFKVISLNSPTEAAVVAEHFPDIPLTIVNRTAEASTGKPYIFFDDVMAALSADGAEICGIVNSDILLLADGGFAGFVSETASDGFLFGSRIDIDSLENLDGEKFIYGFDFFFFNRNIAKLFPQSGFCLGVPWWDYWAPFVPLAKGIPCKELISPVAFHVKHETKWAGELFCDFGRMFADSVTPLAGGAEFAGRITAESSPAELTLFSFDILDHILKNSEQVVYQQSGGGEERIEVGRRQYLAMRGKVIEHHRQIWELNVLLQTANSVVMPCNADAEARLAAIEASLSWRLTRPLRKLMDAFKQLREL